MNPRLLAAKTKVRAVAVSVLGDVIVGLLDVVPGLQRIVQDRQLRRATARREAETTVRLPPKPAQKPSRRSSDKKPGVN